VTRSLFYKVRVFHGCRADDDTIDALFEPRRDRRHIANSTSELHRQRYAFEDSLDGASVDRVTGKRTIKIDHVQIFEPLCFEAQSLGRCVAIEYGCSRHVTLLQTHANAILEIDSGKQDQDSCPSSRIRRRRSNVTAST